MPMPHPDNLRAAKATLEALRADMRERNKDAATDTVYILSILTITNTIEILERIIPVAECPQPLPDILKSSQGDD
jgi:hypothetical protein